MGSRSSAVFKNILYVGTPLVQKNYAIATGTRCSASVYPVQIGCS